MAIEVPRVGESAAFSPRSSVSRSKPGAAWRAEGHRNQSAAPKAIVNVAVPIFHSKLFFDAGMSFTGPSSSKNRASPISRNRCLKSLSRQRRNKRSVFGGTRFQSGSLVRTAAIVSVRVGPLNSRCPVSSSYSTTPNDQISERLSTGTPRACSGLMYPAVPSRTPSRVGDNVAVGELTRSSPAANGSAAFAKPKSSTFTRPAGVTIMFDGFRSRWMIPFSCAAPIASAICPA